MKLIDLNFHASNEYADPAEVINRHWPSLGYVEQLKDRVPGEVIKHIDHEGSFFTGAIKCVFFKSRNRFWYIPFGTLRYIKTQRPCFVLVQGFVFPLQVACLRLYIGGKGKICLQHHGEQPFKGIKGLLQRMADRFVDAYAFASTEMARDWVRAGVISSPRKCHEIMGVSTSFTRQEKKSSKERTGISGQPAFLWVGRLNQNKDPLTVLKGFAKYLRINPAASLYMIYQDNDLETVLQEMIVEDSLLSKNVRLVGKVPHEELSYWFSAADFFISGSHREGSGYALIEAMACGCIPVVTNIPSFKKITHGGHCGLLYEPGNVDELLKTLIQSSQLDLSVEANKVLAQFNNNLSFDAYANQVLQVMQSVG